nr:glycosyl transferase [Vibrio lentus]
GLFTTQFFFPTAIGACIFSTKRAHDEIGGFDEEIVLCEDCDYVKRASKTWRFRFLNMTFGFDPRRLDQDGVVKTGSTYLKANVRRFFKGEMRNNEMNYKFGHYKEQ